MKTRTVEQFIVEVCYESDEAPSSREGWRIAEKLKGALRNFRAKNIDIKWWADDVKIHVKQFDVLCDTCGEPTTINENHRRVCPKCGVV